MAQFYESGSFCPVYMHVYGTYMYCKLILIACGKTFEMFAENLLSQIFFNITVSYICALLIYLIKKLGS